MIINHQQFDNIHGMKIVQNMDERRNIVVTQQFQKAYDSAGQLGQVVPNDKVNTTIKVHKHRLNHSQNSAKLKPKLATSELDNVHTKSDPVAERQRLI